MERNTERLPKLSYYRTLWNRRPNLNSILSLVHVTISFEYVLLLITKNAFKNLYTSGEQCDTMRENTVFGIRQGWLKILALLLTNSMTLEKFLNLAKHQWIQL